MFLVKLYHFLALKLPFFKTAWQSYRLSHINALLNHIFKGINPWKFGKNNILFQIPNPFFFSPMKLRHGWDSNLIITQSWFTAKKTHTWVKVRNTVYCKHRWSYFELFGSFFIFWDSKVSSCIFFSVATLGGSSSQSSLRQTCESPTSFISCYSCSTAPAIP